MSHFGRYFALLTTSLTFSSCYSKNKPSIPAHRQFSVIKYHDEESSSNLEIYTDEKRGLSCIFNASRNPTVRNLKQVQVWLPGAPFNISSEKGRKDFGTFLRQYGKECLDLKFESDMSLIRNGLTFNSGRVDFDTVSVR